MRTYKNATNVYSIREAKFVEQKEKIQVDKSDIMRKNLKTRKRLGNFDKPHGRVFYL